jgi:hypothetical protein
MGRIGIDTVDRADRNTGRFVVMAYAFGTQIGIDLIDLFAHGDGLIRTFWLTHVAVDAAIVYQ